MTAKIDPFSGKTYEIAADLSEPLIIENFDPTKDIIRLTNNTELNTIPHLSFADEYSLAVSDGDTFIKNLYGKIVAIVKDTEDLQLFTGYTPKGTFTLLSLDNEFFTQTLAPTFFESWYVEFDKSDYGNSVQEAIDAGLVDSAYEHYIKFGQYEAREDSLFAAATDGNNTIYGTGYETGLVGVPISDGVYTRDITPLSTGEGEIDVLVGGTAEDTFFLGNAALINEKAQAFYVGGGDNDYALIKNLEPDNINGFPYNDGEEYPAEELADRVFLAGKPYDYKYEKVEGETRISTKDGDLIAIIEGEVTLDSAWSPIPGGFYLYPVDLPTAYIPTVFTKPYFNESFYLTEYPEVAEAIANGEYASGYEHYIKVGQFDPEFEMVLSGTAGDDGIMIGVSGGGNGASELQFGVPLTFIDGEKEGWTTGTTGVGEQDYFRGGMGATTFFIGNDQILDPSKPIDVYYVGEGDEDFAYIDSFDPYKDFIFAAGNFEDYTIESVDETIDEYGRTATIRNLEISYQGDLVARVVNIDGSLTLEDGWTLQEFDFGDERPNAFAFVAPINEFLPPETLSPFTGETFVIDADATEVLIIEDFDSAKDSIQLPANPDSEVIPQFSFKDRYILTEIDGDTVISTLTGQLLAVVKGVTGLKTFTGYTEKGTYSLVSLENEFFSTYLEANFFEPWYLEFDASDYGNSVQKAIDAGLVDSAYEHYLKFGQFEAREDGLFAPTTDGNNTLYGSGYENGLVGVPISEGFYTRDVKPITTGVGEIDTLIGAPGEDTFFLGNVAMLNETAQPFYVGEGDSDYVLIKGFGEGSTYGAIFAETGFPESSGREALTDRILLAGKPYDYEFERVGEDIKIFFQDDLIAVIEDLPSLDQHFYIPGGTYIYTAGNVATFQGWGSENTLYEPFYFELNPGVEEAIANGEYKSALDHLVKVGQFNPEGEVIFSGSAGDDAVVGLGAASLLFGVEVTFVDGEKEGYRTATTGVGEADFAVGSFGVDTFFIGNDNLLDPEKDGEVWYVGNGDEDFLTIQGFDPYKDFLFGAGDFADYTFEVAEDSTDGYPFKSLEVNYQGDRVALIKEIDGSLTLPDITSLISFPLGDERPNGLALVAPQNEFLPPEPPAGSEYFNADVYAAFNPDIFEFIGEGKPYTDVLDYYIQEGQFREDGGGHGFFNGTSGNDVIQGFGFDKDLFGVAYTSVTGSAPDEVVLVPETLGVGEIDTYIGSEGIDGFYAAAFTKVDFGNFSGDAEALYIGEGDGDYALIKDFDSTKDYFALAGSPADYIYKIESNDFKVYTAEGDLVAVIEDTTDLILKNENIFSTLNVFTLTGDEAGKSLGFDEEAYLGIYPEVAQLIEEGKFASALEHYIKVGQYEEGGGIHSGTSGDDTVLSWTQNAEVRLSGVDYIVAEPAGFEEGQNYLGIKPASFGVGEIDTLILDAGTGAISEALLGYFRGADGSIQRYYVGQGDEDYALVKNFNKNDIDEIFLAGVPEDYTYEDVDGNLHIAYQGDLVGIVEGVKFDEMELADEGEGSGAFVLIGKPDEVEPNPKTFFNESIYLTFHPKVQELIDSGEYESAYDYYLEVGEDKGHRAFLTGTAEGNDDLTAIGDKSTLIGVEVTGYDKETKQFITAGDGSGETDTLTGNEGKNRFFLGEAGESFYLGDGDADYATIKNFDPIKDRIILGGAAGDYTYETVDGNFQIAQDGDLVAIVEGISDLKPFTGSTLEDRSQLLSLDNQFFDKYIEPNFYAPIYPIQNTDVDALIEAGEYTSYYDHFLKAGQFEEREDTFFVGTEGNDTLYALGYETVLVGVPISDAVYGPVDVVPLSLGTGQVDTLYGGNTFEAIYVLGNGTQLNETAQSFYMGEGDADYALIKDFSPNDVVFMGSDVSNFTQEVVDGNLEISKDGDLIAIVENSGLLIGNGEFFNNFNYIQGTAGDDTLDLSGAANAIGVPLTLTENYLPLATGTGVGEVDTFNFLDAEATNPIYLGFTTVDSPDTPQTFYLGNGDADYALIKNFNPLTDHNVLIPGKFEDYEVEIVDGNTRISQEGDLIAIVENTILVPDIDADGFINLYPSEDEYFVENTQPFFNEAIYLENNPDVADAIAADEYASGYQHFMRVGLLEGRDAYYNGTAGDEADIYAMGNSYVLGVPVTGFDAVTGQFTTETMGMGEADSLTGTVGVNKFVLGGNGESFYLGEGAADSATVNSFDVLKDELILGGSYEDYTFAVVEENLQISLGDDLVATVNGVTELQEKTGDDSMEMFTLVSPEFTGVDPFAV
jgi:hypothetical protein